MKTLKYTLYVAATFMLVSCSEIYNEASTPLTVFGLPHVAIEMRESDFINLQKDALVNEYAAITIEINGVKKTGRMRRRGSTSRHFPKPSFRLKTSDGDWDYVAANADKSYCREILANIIFGKDDNFLVQELKFVALSINNIYQGLYISREPINEKFFERRNIAVNSLYRIRWAGEFTSKDGHNSAMDFQKIIPESSINYDDLNILISALDENNPKKIEQILHIDNVAKYSLISSAINNSDGISNNLYIFNAKNDNRFQIIPYDLDVTFRNPYKFHKFENGLLERAENIYLKNRELEREQYIETYVSGWDNLFGILNILKNEISQAYKNDPYHQGENLDEHIEEIKRYISVMLKY